MKQAIFILILLAFIAGIAGCSSEPVTVTRKWVDVRDEGTFLCVALKNDSTKNTLISVGYHVGAWSNYAQTVISGSTETDESFSGLTFTPCVVAPEHRIHEFKPDEEPTFEVKIEYP